MAEEAARQPEITPESFANAFDEPEKVETIATQVGTAIGDAIRERKKEPVKDYSFPKKWALIRLEQQRNESDVVDVPVSVNGYNILLQRGVWVPVNWAFVEGLRNAKHPVYSNKPGAQRKVVGMFTRFPFQAHEVTEDEFNALRKIAVQREITIADIPERYRGTIDMAV